MNGSHDGSVRPIPTDTEKGNRHRACTDPDNDLTRITADHDNCAIKVSFLADRSAKQFSDFTQQEVTIDWFFVNHCSCPYFCNLCITDQTSWSECS